MKVGYVRASAEDQNTARQIVAMKANGVEKIFEEKKSGKNADREQLTASKVEFISLKESIDTTTPQGRFMLTVFGAMAELERESILQRQREGIAIAKEEGKYKGRKPIEIDEASFKAICTSWRAGEITGVEAANRAGLKKNTFYRRVKELGL